MLPFPKNQLWWFYCILNFCFSVICITLVLADSSMVRPQSKVSSWFFWGFRSLWPLSTSHTCDFCQLSYMLNTCVGCGQGWIGCWAQNKTQIWSNRPLAHVKFRLGELPGPAHFFQAPCHDEWRHWSHPCPLWDNNHPTLSVSVLVLNSFRLESLLLFPWSTVIFPAQMSQSPLRFQGKDLWARRGRTPSSEFL